MFNLEKLDVWREAIEFADLVYSVTRTFPEAERFGQRTRCGALRFRFPPTLPKAAPALPGRTLPVSPSWPAVPFSRWFHKRRLAGDKGSCLSRIMLAFTVPAKSKAKC